MKKRMLWLLLPLLIAAALLGVTADFRVYRPASRTLPQGEGELFFTVTAFDGKSEREPFVNCLGHAWISLANPTDHPVTLRGIAILPGETLTLSAWATDRRRGVFYNLEPNFIRQYGRYDGRMSLTVRIGEDRLGEIESYIDAHDRWTFYANCSCWSLGLWNAIVPEEAKLPAQLLLYTPTRLQNAMREYREVEQNRDFSAAGGAFCIENGVRKELSLCE